MALWEKSAVLRLHAPLPSGAAMKKERKMSDTSMPADTEANQNSPGLSAEVQRAMGTRIRAAYGELVREPLPDKFKELLDKLAQSEKKSDH
jgi:Anti-sigma factor NepR